MPRYDIIWFPYINHYEQYIHHIWTVISSLIFIKTPQVFPVVDRAATQEAQWIDGPFHRLAHQSHHAGRQNSGQLGMDMMTDVTDDSNLEVLGGSSHGS